MPNNKIVQDNCTKILTMKGGTQNANYRRTFKKS